ncbi:hypothetical protein [Demequina lignilytica]|uniref:Roadblock/LAMTOR2 domain-containing protein n=1 Tax=Demequina lignilytica TaxID=3051663 RepID=A0AB35MFG8_9MICO|nr:hypothetical protein [Demequina sp. SYSU T0a273]MDN4482510.1 hypothetical protein [Demequina sp. SYSU T0a273]
MATANESVQAAVSLDGALAAALVDYDSGMTLATAGGGIDLELAGAGNTEVVRAKLRVMGSLGLDDAIEDILITLGKQFHLIRLVASASGQGLFLYLVLDKSRANLAMARRQLQTIEQALEI